MTDPSIDHFWYACGAAAPLRLRVINAHGPETLTVPLPFAVIGSDPASDVCFGDAAVSRCHAYLQMIGGRLFCMDLASRTGIHWEDGNQANGWLEDNHVVRIGPFSLQNESPGKASEPATGIDFDPLTDVPPAAEALPEVMVDFFKGGRRETSWRIKRMLTLVGRSDRCRVRLGDSSISRFHCGILRTPLGIWVVDLRGKEGITVNDRRVRWARLDDRDRLQVGVYTLHVRHGEEPTPAVFSPDTQSRVTPSDPVLAAPMALLAPLSVPNPLEWLDTRALANLDSQEITKHVLVPLVNQFGLMQQQMFDQFQQTVMMMVQMFSSLHREQVGLIRQELDRLEDLTRELQSLQQELNQRPPAGTEATPPPTFTEPLLYDAGFRQSNGTRDKHGAAGTPSIENEPTPIPPSVQTEDDIHVWLYERIAAIQKERQTRWQTIMNFLKGK